MMETKEFFYDFGKALYHVDAVYDDFAKGSGVVSPTLLWILYALNDGNEHTQREICVDWALPKSTVNTVMMELKKSGYVELEPIKGKRREMAVLLTQSGKEYADSLLAGIYKKEAEAFDKLSADEKNVTRYLARIAELLK
ncbi:MAG: hypothetical protein PHX26_01330 [Proteiniphilum sp.]|jgi:DNA-binding MarR family transcriptional regulator|nr:hypothetical protein [Proteiniphilum sp.]